jgi:hypothetical protein
VTAKNRHGKGKNVQTAFHLRELNPEAAPLQHTVAPADINQAFAFTLPDHVAGVMLLPAIALQKNSFASPVTHEYRWAADIHQAFLAGSHRPGLVVEDHDGAVRGRLSNGIGFYAILRNRFGDGRAGAGIGFRGTPQVVKVRPPGKTLPI